MQPTDQDEIQIKIGARIRTIRTVWFALFMSVAIYYVFAVFIPQPSVPNSMLSLALGGLGILLVLISLPVKQRFLTKSVEQQSPALVQQGYLMACALSEAAALLGLVDHFATGNPYFYVLFIIADCGMLLSFPRLQHVQDACFKVDGLNQVRDF